jgi:hypothetical protein
MRCCIAEVGEMLIVMWAAVLIQLQVGRRVLTHEADVDFVKHRLLRCLRVAIDCVAVLIVVLRGGVLIATKDW